MAWAAVDEAIRNVVAAGGDPDACALLDNFSWGDCRKEDRLGSIVRAARACHDAALAHRAPFISGKDSLQNEYVLEDGRSISIPGTLLITCVAVAEDVRRLVSIDLKVPGSSLYVLGATRAELAGSIYDAVTLASGGHAPAPATEAPALYRKFHAAARAGLVRSAHDLSEGGLACALAESAFSGGVGAWVDLASLARDHDVRSDVEALFSESGGRLLVEVEAQNVRAFEAALSGCAFSRVGRTMREPRLTIRGLEGKVVLDVDLDRLKTAWRRPLFELFGEGAG
jgi:phosphoribosylformylglycinamidine synthase